jgi:hypothetical protein
MHRSRFAASHFVFFALSLMICLCTTEVRASQPTPAAIAAYASYIDGAEARLAHQHQSSDHFLAPTQGTLARGQFAIEQITPAAPPDLPGAMLHHWRGTAFVPGATAAQLDRIFRNFAAYPQIYSPQVVTSRVLEQQGDHAHIIMRVRQHHVLTAVLDTTYDVTFAHLDARHGYSLSRSSHIAEIASPGSSSEHALGPDVEHGFLWRLNTYWSYEARDGGLYLQIESVSLTRSIPAGVGWAIGPFVQSIPRESLAFTLHSTCAALERKP